MNNNSSGFTIIEILIAILIFGILMALLSATLTGSLKLNQQSQQQVNTTSEAQRIIEDIRSSWETQSSYDAVCSQGLTLSTGYTAKYTNLDSRAGVVSTPTANSIAGTCPATTPTVTSPVVMRRIQVSSGSGAQNTILTLDVLRPLE